MPLLIFIYSMMQQLISKYEPFWEKVSVKSLNLGWPLKPLGLLFFFKAHLGINFKVNMLWGSVKCLHLVEFTRAFHNWQFIIQDWSISFAKSLFLEICILKWSITSINLFEKNIYCVCFSLIWRRHHYRESFKWRAVNGLGLLRTGIEPWSPACMRGERSTYHYCGGYIVVMFRCIL